jgi:formate hydrogenlyase transcriptional activator
MPYPLISEGEQELTAHTPEFQTSESIHESLVRRYRALLDMAGVFAREHDIPQLFVELSRWLRDVAHFDLLIFALRDPVDNQMRLTFVHQEDQSSRLDMRVDGAATGWTWESQECVVIPDISREVRYPDTMKYLREFGMTSACLLPLTAPCSGRLGALGFASSAPLTYTETDIEFLQSVAQLCAVAVDNVLTHQALKQDKQKSELLLEISRSLSSSLKFERLFPAITNSLCSILPLDHAAISFPDKVRDGVNLFVIHPPLENCGPGEFIPSADSLAMPAIRERKVFVYSRSDLEKTRSSIGRRIFDLGVQHVVSYPLITSHGVIGSLTVGSSKSPLNGSSEYGLLCHLANHIAIALENARAYQEIAELKAKLAEEKLYLEDEIRTELNFEEIIGDSPQLKHALADVKTVADSDANVLILGDRDR